MKNFWKKFDPWTLIFGFSTGIILCIILSQFITCLQQITCNNWLDILIIFFGTTTLFLIVLGHKFYWYQRFICSLLLTIITLMMIGGIMYKNETFPWTKVSFRCGPFIFSIQNTLSGENYKKCNVDSDCTENNNILSYFPNDEKESVRNLLENNDNLKKLSNQLSPKNVSHTLEKIKDFRKTKMNNIFYNEKSSNKLNQNDLLELLIVDSAVLEALKEIQDLSCQ